MNSSKIKNNQSTEYVQCTGHQYTWGPFRSRGLADQKFGHAGVQGHGRASRSLASDAAVVPKGQNRNEGLGPMDQVVRMRRCTGGGRLLPLVTRIR